MDSSVYFSVKPLPPDQKIIATLSVQWKVCTGKCVDASPLVSCRMKGLEQRVAVYIGSHSGDFLAIDFVMGSVLWKFKLGDRVESSACMTKCGLYVAVGTCDLNWTMHVKCVPLCSLNSFQ